MTSGGTVYYRFIYFYDHTLSRKIYCKVDIVFFSADSPVLWLRLDPDMTMMRAVEVEQPDNQWQYQLRHERDVTAQTEAINALHRLAKQSKNVQCCAGSKLLSLK